MDISQHLRTRQVFNFDSPRYTTNRNFLITIDNPGLLYPRKLMEEQHDNNTKDLVTAGTSSFRDVFLSLTDETSTNAGAFYNSLWDNKERLHVGKDVLNEETFFYTEEASNSMRELLDKHKDILALYRAGENEVNQDIHNLGKLVQQFSPITSSFDSKFLIHFETVGSFRWNDLKWKVLTVYKSILDGLFSKENGLGYFGKSLMSIQRYDYGDIVKILQSEFDDDLKSNKSSLISDIENAFNISRLVATNEIRKLELEDIQGDLIHLKSLMENPTKDQTTNDRIKEIRNTLIEKLNSGIELEKFLRHLGTSEMEIENKLEQVENEDGVFEIRWKDH